MWVSFSPTERWVHTMLMTNNWNSALLTLQLQAPMNWWTSNVLWFDLLLQSLVHVLTLYFLQPENRAPPNTNQMWKSNVCWFDSLLQSLLQTKPKIYLSRIIYYIIVSIRNQGYWKKSKKKCIVHMSAKDGYLVTF